MSPEFLPTTYRLIRWVLILMKGEGSMVKIVDGLMRSWKTRERNAGHEDNLLSNINLKLKEIRSHHSTPSEDGVIIHLPAWNAE